MTQEEIAQRTASLLAALENQLAERIAYIRAAIADKPEETDGD